VPALDDDREEALAQELAKGIAQGTAYVTAGYSAKNNNVASVNCNRLLKKAKYITERADELRAIARDQMLTEEFKADLEGLTKAYLEDRVLARQLGQPSAAVSALNSIAKMRGLMSDTVKHVGDPANPIITEVIVRGVSAANR
jgi:phage terminase small subunit